MTPFIKDFFLITVIHQVNIAGSYIGGLWNLTPKSNEEIIASVREGPSHVW